MKKLFFFQKKVFFLRRAAYSKRNCCRYKNQSSKHRSYHSEKKFLEMKINIGLLVFLVCFSSSKAQNLPGNVGEINQEEVDLFIKEAIDHVNVDEEPDYVFKGIVSSSGQVVAGIRYLIEAELVHDGKDVVCKFDIWEQAWVKDGRKVSIECDNKKIYNFNQNPVGQREKSRKRRQLGAPSEISADDATVNQLLKDHISRLDTGSKSTLEVVKIDKITSQVVAGMKYKITGLFKIGSDEKTCTVEIWHRAWIETPDATNLEADCGGSKLVTKS